MYVLQTEIKLQFLVAARVKLRKTGRDERRTQTIQEHQNRRRSGRSATSAMFFVEGHANAALNNKWTALHVTSNLKKKNRTKAATITTATSTCSSKMASKKLSIKIISDLA